MQTSFDERLTGCATMVVLTPACVSPATVAQRILAPAVFASAILLLGSCRLYAQVATFNGPVPNSPIQNHPLQNGSGASRLPPTPPTAASPGATSATPGTGVQATGAPSAPTSSVPSSPVPAPIAATPLPNRTSAQRAEVSYSGGLIDVRANNSSLRQILRAISRQTGMTIVGGITDDRVFGNYGPDTPAVVLATLVYGTGTNMLLREGDATHPMQLVLTPQKGGVSPGNDSMGSDAEDDSAAASLRAQQAGQGAGPAPPVPAAALGNGNPSRSTQTTLAPQPSLPPSNVNGSPSNTSPTASDFPTTNSVPIDSLPTPSTTPSSSGIVDAPNPPSSGAGATSNTAPTPEQVYQQLLKMQQGQQANPGPGSTGTPPQ